ARALPAPGWPARLAEQTPELGGLEAGRPNPTEAFLRLARRQVLARIPGARAGPAPRGALECDLAPADPELAEAAMRLERALGRIAEPLATLRTRLAERLEAEAEELGE